jgi:DNA-binding transcriptional LysR family regulator
VTASRSGQGGEVGRATAPSQRLSARQIEVFRAVMIAGSLSGASRQLNVAQPSLTRMVRRIEDVVGFTLFDRYRGRLRPTLEAQQVFWRIQHIQAQLDSLDDAIGQIARGETATFRLAASPSLARQLVPMALARLREKFPGLSLQLDQASLPHIVDYLALGIGECVLTVTPVIHPTVESRSLWPGSLVCLMPAEHPLAARASIGAADLLDAPLIVCGSGTPHRRMVQAVFEEIGAVPRVSVVGQFAESAIGLTRAGLGLAIVDEFTAMDAASDEVTVRPLDLVPRFHVHINRNRNAIQSRMATTFEEILLDVLGERSLLRDEVQRATPRHRERPMP